MPIYEFYCEHCHRIFNFFSSRVNTEKIPSCPLCNNPDLKKQISPFATIGRARETEEGLPEGLDEAKMEKALQSLMGEVDRVDENDPRQMADLMRKFSSQAGIQYGQSFEEALERLERGEDPDSVEKDMGDLLDGDDFTLANMKKQVRNMKTAPAKDDKLYEL